MMTTRGQETVTEAIILAGGKGTRLKDAVSDRPKPLAVVAGKAFIEWLLLLLRKEGIRRVVLSVGHMGEMIQSQLGTDTRFGLELAYVHDPFPLGTGGALRNALPAIHSSPLLVLNGDSYCRVRMDALTGFHFGHESSATLLVAGVSDASRFGTVEIGESGTVKAFHEKAPLAHPGLINAGVYLLNRDIVETISTTESVSLERQVFPGLIGRGLHAMEAEGPFWDIGTIESYTMANSILAGEFASLREVEKAL